MKKYTLIKQKDKICQFIIKISKFPYPGILILHCSFPAKSTVVAAKGSYSTVICHLMKKSESRNKSFSIAPLQINSMASLCWPKTPYHHKTLLRRKQQANNSTNLLSNLHTPSVKWGGPFTPPLGVNYVRPPLSQLSGTLANCISCVACLPIVLAVWHIYQ